jgi:predicted GNAT family N-acyltransferase
MCMSSFRVLTGNWQQCNQHAKPIRHQVFVLEQKVPPELELDDHDATAVHALVYATGGEAVGTGRLLPDGHIGRVAVLQAWRGQGVGAMIMRALVEHARQQGYPQLELSAQCHARSFYENLGFQAFGDTYQEAGIEHIAMKQVLVSN